MIHTVLAYDVVEDRRRRRLFKRLNEHLVPVQKSVFEGRIGRAQREKIEEMVVRELDLATDRVRLFPLCANCRHGIESWGPDGPIHDPDEPFIIARPRLWYPGVERGHR